jgi:methylthioribulose 1-phosphate dehydratase / enolase-phosphatase E1
MLYVLARWCCLCTHAARPQDVQSSGKALPKVPAANSAAKSDVVTAVVANVHHQMDADRKTTSLKALQGLIWTRAFASGEIKGELYRDVPDALQRWRDAGVKSYIYSSGSRRAQRDLFGHTTVGDLRPYLMGFFDTTRGPKEEAGSYREIACALGADAPSDILFATDVVDEARAAREAGWSAVLVARPGNVALPQRHEFTVVESMDALLAAYASS